MGFFSTFQKIAVDATNFNGTSAGVSEIVCVLCAIFTSTLMICFWNRYTVLFKILLAFILVQCGEYLFMNCLWDKQIDVGMIHISSIENASWRFFETMYFSLLIILMGLYTELTNFKIICLLEVALRNNDHGKICMYDKLTPRGWEKGFFRSIIMTSSVVYFGSWILLFVLQKG